MTLIEQWHFFATSHGKSPYEGLGGTTKRLVTKASLQATVTNPVSTPEQMFCISRSNYCWHKIPVGQ